MIRLQRRESGPYSAAFSLRIPNMRVEIDRICPRALAVSLSNIWVGRAAESRVAPGEKTNKVSSGRNSPFCFSAGSREQGERYAGTTYSTDLRED